MEVTFYPTISRGEAGKYLDGTTTRALLTASSYAAEEVKKYGHVRDKIAIPRLNGGQPGLPASITDRAADCGGFVATFKWGGTYPYTPQQYVTWLSAWQPTWAATMDYCCEDEVTQGRPGLVEQRQRGTTRMARYFWRHYRACPWVWVPTIQGWTVTDYRQHARCMKPLILEMQAHYGPLSAFRVGIGTLCHRASVEMIRAVVLAVVEILGEVKIHLWGVKMSIFKSPIALPRQVVSCDSAAFNGMWGKGRNEWKESGKRQAQYTLENKLPEYQAKLERVTRLPKMDSLFEEVS